MAAVHGGADLAGWLVPFLEVLGRGAVIGLDLGLFPQRRAPEHGRVC
jgi:hypothetical protein